MLDAIHLATALACRRQIGGLRLATHDAELARAARSDGFAVLGPHRDDCVWAAR